MCVRARVCVCVSSYESDNTGPMLPADWLEHIRVADEFEVVNRGPIVMVYTRQRNAPSLRLGTENTLSWL